MSDLVWLNGTITPFSQARLGLEDRGFQFADGVYEVIRIYAGQPFTLAEHLDRLQNSARGIEIDLPLPLAELQRQIEAFIPRTGVGDGMIYLQLTRGQSSRNHLYPSNVKPTLLFYARSLPAAVAPGSGEGVRLLTVADERWKRCWIKSIALLPNVLAKNKAARLGFDEAVFIENGIASECSTSNLFAVLNDRLITHPVGTKVLPGITRQIILQLAAAMKIPIVERPLGIDEIRHADELFISSTTRELAWVAALDDLAIGQGHCGDVTLRLHEAYQRRVRGSIHNAAA